MCISFSLFSFFIHLFNSPFCSFFRVIVFTRVLTIRTSRKRFNLISISTLPILPQIQFQYSKDTRLCSWTIISNTYMFQILLYIFKHRYSKKRNSYIMDKKLSTREVKFLVTEPSTKRKNRELLET